MTAATEQDVLLPADAGVPADPEPIRITRPGLYDIPEADYHRDPVPGGSLSSTTARHLLSMTPAAVRYEMDHPPAHKDAWDLGSVFHGLVLGRGGRAQVFPGPWNTNKIKAEIADARAAGLVPLTPAKLETAKAMAAAVAEHPIAGPLFQAKHGVAEQTIVSTHERTGTPQRSMIDWIDLDPKLPPLIVDLKSTKDVSPYGIWKAVKEYRYHQQDPFYRAQVASLGHDPAEVGFVFVFVDSAPPHQVNVAKLTDEYLAKGWEHNEQAIDLWVRCTETDTWPEYPAEIVEIEMPGWMA